MTVITSFEKTIDASDIDREDGGQALIVNFSDDRETGIFVRLQSWDESGAHKDFNRMVGQKVRIWIEVDNGLAPLVESKTP